MEYRLEPFAEQMEASERERFLARLKDVGRFVSMGRRLLDWLTMDSHQREIGQSDNLMLTYYHYLGDSSRIPRRVDVYEVVISILHNRLAELRERNLGFARMERFELLVWVHEDALKEVVMGLIENIGKHASHGSMFSIETSENDVEYVLSFRSIGPPLGERLQRDPRELFREGVRGVSKERFKAPPGKGHGLFIARSITKSWGGDLSLAYKHEGKTATYTFSMSFPRFLGMEENPWENK